MKKLIAEIGFNHMGDEKNALNLIKTIAKAKPWGVSVHIGEEEYYDNKKPWRRKLNSTFYKRAKSFLSKKKIKFGIGVYDINALIVTKGLKIDFWKIISTKFFDNKLITSLLKLKQPVYASTGLASMSDIVKKSKKFTSLNFVHTVLDKNISQNLFAIESIKNKIKKEIGYGLHSKDDNLILMAMSFRANPIFFYVRPDKKKIYPDNEHAIIAKELKSKIRYWNSCLNVLGDGRKKI